MDDKEKKEHYKKYGWKCNEENLSTLPKTAPQAAKSLAQWLTLEGRRSSLQEWINCVGDDGRIHGKFWHIGAWTQRMSHSSPNQANIPSIFQGTPSTPVEEIKHRYDAELRALFEADTDAWLVGCDADGIQLRILAHYMESAAYRDAILKGDKSKGTDIHSMNQKALGSVCKTRDDAKTFIYAWVLGASIPKIASILGCSIPVASAAVNKFLDALPELRRLKSIVIPTYVARGGFNGLDGRFVPCTSAHLMLAGMLQSAEAIIMKRANIMWQQQLSSSHYEYKQVDFVHDEWQTVVYGAKTKAQRVGKIQADAILQTSKDLGMFCPVSGSYRVGRDWRSTH